MGGQVDGWAVVHMWLVVWLVVTGSLVGTSVD